MSNSLRVLGVGNCGMLLASEFDDTPLLFSTAHQDTVNFKKTGSVFSFSDEGASKRFKLGKEIWENNIEKLDEILIDIKNDKVIIFSSLGGGSGSSSLNLLSRLLLKRGNKVLIVGILPYKKEINPPLSNSILAINNLMPLIPNVSVMLFDNEKLRKTFGSDWSTINHHIIQVVSYIIYLVQRFSIDKYSPLTLDQSELNSVIFGGGFVDFSETFLEDGNPKFEYGSLDKHTKNCLVAMYVDKKIEDAEMDKYHEIFTNVLDRVSRRVTNSRMIPGILRGSLNRTNSLDGITDRAYITIASGLNIEKYIKKLSRLRDSAIKKAIAYNEKEKGERIVDASEGRLLDL